jgi:hypothetical protein
LPRDINAISVVVRSLLLPCAALIDYSLRLAVRLKPDVLLRGAKAMRAFDGNVSTGRAARRASSTLLALFIAAAF